VHEVNVAISGAARIRESFIIRSSLDEFARACRAERAVEAWGAAVVQVNRFPAVTTRKKK